MYAASFVPLDLYIRVMLCVFSPTGTSLLAGVGTVQGSSLSEAHAGVILLVCSLAAMIICLLLLVKILTSLMRGPMATIIRRFINAELPGKAAFLTGYVAMVIGAGVTMLVQSSSVFTCTLTPLVGMGLVTVERVYPLTLGSNIGTTFTSLLSALAADSTKIRYTLQIALCHLFFNITGIIIFYPVPLMRRAPVHIAKWMGDKTAKYRWFAVVYLLGMFFVIPGAILGLSVAGWYVLLAVGGPCLLVLIFVVVINVSQNRCKERMVPVLRNWDWLPLWMHSCKPCDRACAVSYKTTCPSVPRDDVATIVAPSFGDSVRVDIPSEQLDVGEFFTALNLHFPTYIEATGGAANIYDKGAFPADIERVEKMPDMYNTYL